MKKNGFNLRTERTKQTAEEFDWSDRTALNAVIGQPAAVLFNPAFTVLLQKAGVCLSIGEKLQTGVYPAFYKIH